MNQPPAERLLGQLQRGLRPPVGPARPAPPPPGAALDERRRFPRDPEHTPGWLDARPAQGMRIAKPFDGTAADGRPDVPGAERDAMVRYLEQAPIVLAARSYDADALDPDHARNVPLTYHTDGTWIWPGAVGYYLRVHGVGPEAALVRDRHRQRKVWPAAAVGRVAGQSARGRSSPWNRSMSGYGFHSARGR